MAILNRLERQAEIQAKIKALREEELKLREEFRNLDLKPCTREAICTGRIVYLRDNALYKYGVPRGAKGKVVKLRRVYVLVAFPGHNSKYTNFLLNPWNLSFEKP